MRISKNLDIGHFTQLVWKNTQLVGFGKSFDDQGCVYIVANYFPPGNIVKIIQFRKYLKYF